MSVILKSWEVGMRKVAFDKLVQRDTGLSLSAAKDAVDRLLAGDEVELQLRSGVLPKDFIARAAALGVLAVEK